MELCLSVTTVKWIMDGVLHNGIGVPFLPLQVPKELQSETQSEKGAMDEGVQTRERKGHSRCTNCVGRCVIRLGLDV